MIKAKIRNRLLKLRYKKYNSKLKISFNKIFKKIKLLKKNNLIIGGYYPVNYEIDCLEILRKLEKKKFRISLPIIGSKNSMNFFTYSFEEPLIINKFGIPEPKKNKKILPDIIFVPLVAFDKNNYRLGYGGGYYDRYLAKLNKNKLITIGFSFSFQKVNNIPVDGYDKKLDMIVTENGFVK